MKAWRKKVLDCPVFPAVRPSGKSPCGGFRILRSANGGDNGNSGGGSRGAHLTGPFRVQAADGDNGQG